VVYAAVVLAVSTPAVVGVALLAAGLPILSPERGSR